MNLTINTFLNNYLIKTLLVLLLTTLSFTVFAQPQSAQYANDGCAIERATEDMYQAHPGLKEKMRAQLEALKNQPQNLKSGHAPGDVIPVVFHIINAPCGVSFDFTKADFQSILADVNTDFAGQNTGEYDVTTEPPFYETHAGDIELEFRLAEIDPHGNPTDGITRPTTSIFSLDGLNFQTPLKEIVQWNPSRYLNVWVVQDLDGASGVAQYPITAANRPEVDGIVMDYDYMKMGNTSRDNILTHEIGHWLGLLHTWGDFEYPGSCPSGAPTYCECDDLVADTPSNLGYTDTICISPLPNTCNDGVGDLPDNIYNFMDYACEVMFTKDQKTRMWNTINSNIANRQQIVTTDDDDSVFMDDNDQNGFAKLYLDKVVFRESDSNPGTISETGIIELRDCGGCSFSSNIEFDVSGLPASISDNDIQITRLATDPKKAEIDFSNVNLTNPDDHADDIENISITLESDAIIDAPQVFNNRTIGGLKIDFKANGLAYSTYVSGTFATDGSAATRIPYLQTVVGFYSYEGGIYMYTAGSVEAAVTSNPLHVKRMTENQNVNSQSFSPITTGVFGAADELIIYKEGVYTDWLNKTGYVGLKATSCSETYYAWIRIEVTSDNVNILDVVANIDNNGNLNTDQYPSCDSPKAENDGFTSVYIESVNIGQINNVSGYNGGYQFFTNHTTDLIEGDNYVVNCQDSDPNISGYLGGEWRVYIDLNGDGSYLNPDDLRYVIDESQNINQAVQLIPPGTLNGQSQINTTMMVTFSLYPLDDEICEDYQYGETEEYNVTIKASGGTGQTYCESSGGYPAIYISNVSLAEIDNDSGSDGYADYTSSMAANLAPLQTYTISASETTNWNFFWRAWIDYNQNGTFENSELVMDLAGSQSNTVSASFTVPANAATGTTRMRVSQKYYYYLYSPPTACETISYGEVEDYTINIGGAACNVGAACDDNDACTVGDVYDSNCNCVGTFVDADNDGICAANDCDDNDSNIPTAPGTTCNDGNPNTTDDVIQADGCTCEGITPTGNQYCQPTGQHSQIYISNVSLEQINNSTGNDGYADYTNQVADLSQGQSYILSVTESTPWSFYWRGWIDYNQNGTFENSELVLNLNGASGTSQQNIIVPDNAPTGTTRMRIYLKYYSGAAPAPCDNIGLGEVEDYTVNIQATASCNAAVPTSGNLGNSSYCSYAYGYCNGHSGINKEFELTNLSTGAISTYASTSHYTPFSNLTPSTNYQFRVRLECGNTGTYGDWSPYHDFTTTSCRIAQDVVGFGNYPNPFTGQTTIEFTLSKDTSVTLFISDAMGRQVEVLLDNEVKTEGTYLTTFDGSSYPAGMYYYTIQAGEYTGTQKMVLIK